MNRAMEMIERVAAEEEAEAVIREFSEPDLRPKMKINVRPLDRKRREKKKW